MTRVALLALVALIGRAEAAPKAAAIAPASAEAIHREIDKPGAAAVLVNVWASWCEPCREEMPDIIRAYRKHQTRGLRLVLVSGDFDDALEEARRFLASVGVDFPSYQKVGDDMAFINSFDPQWSGEIPVSFLYDSHRKLRHSWRGKVSPRELEQKLDELLKKGK